MQFRTGQRVEVVKRLDGVSHFSWVNSHSDRAEQNTDTVVGDQM